MDRTVTWRGRTDARDARMRARDGRPRQGDARAIGVASFVDVWDLLTDGFRSVDGWVMLSYHSGQEEGW
jgi:hypothetical protein